MEVMDESAAERVLSKAADDAAGNEHPPPNEAASAANGEGDADDDEDDGAAGLRVVDDDDENGQDADHAALFGSDSEDEVKELSQAPSAAYGEAADDATTPSSQRSGGSPGLGALCAKVG